MYTGVYNKLIHNAECVRTCVSACVRACLGKHKYVLKGETGLNQARYQYNNAHKLLYISIFSFKIPVLFVTFKC